MRFIAGITNPVRIDTGDADQRQVMADGGHIQDGDNTDTADEKVPQEEVCTPANEEQTPDEAAAPTDEEPEATTDIEVGLVHQMEAATSQDKPSDSLKEEKRISNTKRGRKPSVKA